MIFFRLANSTVVWSWILNIFRMASGLILLPLVFHQFSKADLGMYYVLLSLAGMAPIIDFGFGPTIDRFISYAMGGAEKLEAHGVPKPGASHHPNYNLLWQLLVTTRRLYRYLTLAVLILLGIGGTLMVEHLIHVEVLIHPAFSPLIPRLAWFATLMSTSLDIYSNWWGIFLRGMNEVRSATRIGVAAQVVKLGLAAGLLLSGVGLLSLPLAGLVSSLVQRHYARVRCLKLLPATPAMTDFDLGKNFRVLWPNSWRLGVQLLSGSLTTQANTFICASVFHLDASAKYGPSVQLMGIAASMAYVWTIIKWPLISQHRARHDDALVQRVLWPRFWLQTFTFLGLAGAVVFVAPGFLHWIGKDKEMLPLPWMLVLALGVFLEMQFTTWSTLIATGNRFPCLWPTVATNVLSLILSLLLVHYTTLGLGALVLGPLLAGCVFNYWYWPFEAARSINTTLFRYLFSAPTKTRSSDNLLREQPAPDSQVVSGDGE
jgi:O-antigen/teichoic acid export membrane protein